VAIVRAIATSPELLLLDEVTSALDPELVGEVLELVRSLADSGTTIMMATHEMAFARDVADRVVFLDDGRIIEEAPAAEFFTAPREERTREFLARFLPGL
jgi:polar amino acid transport system ATP-binding protein